LITIGIKEILVILGIIAFMVWVRMFRTSMEQNTRQFFKKLTAPDHGGTGFGWRGLLVAFAAGIVFCCGFAIIILRIWAFYHPVASAAP